MKEPWNLNIEAVNNGYILTGNEDEETGNKPKTVFEEKEEIQDDNLNESHVVRRMLYEIMNYFGIFNSKHKKYKLEIIVTDQNGHEIDDTGEINE